MIDPFIGSTVPALQLPPLPWQPARPFLSL